MPRASTGSKRQTGCAARVCNSMSCAGSLTSCTYTCMMVLLQYVHGPVVISVQVSMADMCKWRYLIYIEVLLTSA